MPQRKNQTRPDPAWKTSGFWDGVLCAGRSSEYLTANLPASTQQRYAKAYALCNGCPLLIECARRALTVEMSMGMVAAGQPVPDGPRSAKELNRIRRRLERIVAGEQVTYGDIGPELTPREPKVKPEPALVPSRCLSCHCAVRPHRAKVSDYPGTLSEEGRGLCRRCYSRFTRAGTLHQWPAARSGPPARMSSAS